MVILNKESEFQNLFSNDDEVGDVINLNYTLSIALHQGLTMRKRTSSLTLALDY